MKKHGKEKILEPGDRICCQGIICTIKEIVYQEYWEGHGFHTEFRDTDGVYHSWKQEIDGGHVTPKPKKFVNSYGADVTNIMRKYGYC